ncbi:MAG: hypothetical protein HC852_07165 [Acaryochloridaceae cyanobacterium RU_4_10]|nr:hypothetical protein [Acaryochloridaceae cyanobacterium RU_4_10]
MLNKSLIVLPLSLLLAYPALAGVSKSVSIEDALDGRVPIVVAVEGGGVNIDFSETGETVQKVTLDDTSKVLVDFDKSLPIVRLFCGNVGSKDVPSARTTQLSVTTKGTDGDFHLYIFPVTTSSKPATFTKFLIGGASRKRGANNIATAATGAKVAEQNKTLVDPKLKARVAHYVQLRSSGMSDRKAAKRAKISMALAKRLDDLGQSAPTLQTAQQPIEVIRVPSAPVIKTQNTVLAPPPQTYLEPTPKPVEAKVPKVKPIEIKAVEAKPVEDKSVAEPKAIAKVVPVKFDGQQYASALLIGLNKDRLSGHIPYRSVSWYRINGSIRALKRGQSLKRAIRISGMKEARFNELLRSGGIEP